MSCRLPFLGRRKNVPEGFIKFCTEAIDAGSFPALHDLQGSIHLLHHQRPVQLNIGLLRDLRQSILELLQQCFILLIFTAEQRGIHFNGSPSALSWFCQFLPCAGGCGSVSSVHASSPNQRGNWRLETGNLSISHFLWTFSDFLVPHYHSPYL